MNRLLGVAGVLALLAAEAAAQGATTLAARRLLAFPVAPESKSDPKKSPVRWVGDWNVALAEAKQRNVPLVAVLSDDRSAGFQTVSDQVYSRPAFAAFSRKCVLVAAFDGRSHGSKQRTIDGRSVAWCDLFGCPCEEHRRSFEIVHEQFAQREYWHPLQLFVATDGSELSRVEGHKTTQERLDEELALARKALGPGLDEDGHRELLAKLRAIVDGREQKGHAAAHAELARLVESDAKSEKEPAARRALKTKGMREFAEQLMAALLQEGDGLVEDAAALAEKKEFAAARKLLGQVQKSFRGLPPAAAAAQAATLLPPEPEAKGTERN